MRLNSGRKEVYREDLLFLGCFGRISRIMLSEVPKKINFTQNADSTTLYSTLSSLVSFHVLALVTSGEYFDHI